MTADRTNVPATGLSLDAGEDVPKRPIGRYVAGLVGIALLALASTILTASQLTRQESDATVIRAASNQIITASNIAAQASMFDDGLWQPDEVQRNEALEPLRLDLMKLDQVHDGLQRGDSSLGLPGGNTVEIKWMFGARDVERRPALAPSNSKSTCSRRSRTSAAGRLSS